MGLLPCQPFTLGDSQLSTGYNALSIYIISSFAQTQDGFVSLVYSLVLYHTAG